MIYTVTFNPAIDYVVMTDTIRPGEVNRANEERMYFEIKEDGEIVKAFMMDEIIKVPDTLKNESYGTIYFGLILIIVGIGVIVYEKTKKKK